MYPMLRVIMTLNILLSVWLSAADSLAYDSLAKTFSPDRFFNYRRLPSEEPLLLIRLEDSLCARSIRNLPGVMSRFSYDSSSLSKNLDSVLFYTMPYFIKKYGIKVEDSVLIKQRTRESLITSAYFKDILKRWDNKKIWEYLVFRSEYELIRHFYGNFSLDSFKNTKAYGQLINRLAKDYIPADLVDSLLIKVRRIDYAPLHFYYKPNSVQEQIAIDKTDIAALDFSPIVNFYDTNKKWLDSAEIRYGVDKEIIVGILKKETNFGRVTLNYRLFEVLIGQVTRFINNQAALPEEIKAQEKRIERLIRSAGNSLFHAVKYSLSNRLSPDSVKSNLVGAMGFPQFMPFNFGLAEDADGDGRADLSSMPDAIFSVANFFRDKGWREPLGYDEDNKEQVIKYILSYNSNPSYAEAVYGIAKELHKIKNGETKLKQPKKKKSRKHRAKKKKTAKKHK